MNACMHGNGTLKVSPYEIVDENKLLSTHLVFSFKIRKQLFVWIVYVFIKFSQTLS